MFTPASTVKEGADTNFLLRLGGGVVASFFGFSDSGEALVVLPGNPEGAPQVALSCIDLLPAHAGQRVVVVLESGAPGRPIILGRIRAPMGTPVDCSEASTAEAAAREGPVSGHNVSLQADHSMTLQCGKARITLHHDGRISIRGVQLLSEADGVNRIRGGSIELN